MPWIDERLQEGQLQNNLSSLLTTAGWELVLQFKKVAFDKKWLDPEFLSETFPSTKFNCFVANHYIWKSQAGMYFGLAIGADISMMMFDIPNEAQPKNDQANQYANLANFFTNKFPLFKQGHTLYMYMLEKEPNHVPKVNTDSPAGEDVVIVWEGDLKRAALDIEVIETKVDSIPTQSDPILRVTVVESRPDLLQSPIAEARIRVPALESYQSDHGANFVDTNTNWWNDSIIRLRGQLDGETMFVIFEPDAAAAYDSNQVPMMPVFWGKFACHDETLKMNALFAGSATASKQQNYEFDSVTPINSILQPLQKNYMSNPSNGVDNIMVHKTIGGSRYQAHHLNMKVSPNAMPPERKGPNGGEYPRAFRQSGSSFLNYQYNPSRHTNKVHSSTIYIKHADDGDVGILPNCVATMPMSIQDGDILKVEKQYCPDSYDNYRYFLIEAISPFTKIPATAYRPVGLGLLEESDVS
ncbi:hypothetical protein LC040_12095 [Bacillus tianshenii]|nr:hypothetical protein LC040_12095 [Bacillus tianshenii]